jgi:hypothetical protein
MGFLAGLPIHFIGNRMLECSKHFRVFYPCGTSCARIGQQNPARVLERLDLEPAEPAI